MEKTIGAWEARRRLGQLIEESFYHKDHFVIERSGRPMAVIVPLDDYRKWQRLAKERIFIMLEEVWNRTQAVPAAELKLILSKPWKPSGKSYLRACLKSPLV